MYCSSTDSYKARGLGSAEKPSVVVTLCLLLSVSALSLSLLTTSQSVRGSHMKRKRRTQSRREIIRGGGGGGGDEPVIYPTISTYRTQPKQLPPLAQARPLSYSETLKAGSSNYRNKKKSGSRREDVPKTGLHSTDISRKNSIKSTRERFRDENVVVVRDNVRAVRESEGVSSNHSNNPSPDNLNPFHHDFNKVIDNPFLLSQEVSMTTELTDDNESKISSLPVWVPGPRRHKETVNRAIVDIYPSDGGCDPFLKMRVSEH